MGNDKDNQQTSQELTLEERLSEVRRITELLEKGSLPLEEALGQFEKGIALIRECSAQIDRVAKRIRVLEEENQEGITGQNTEEAEQ